MPISFLSFLQPDEEERKRREEAKRLAIELARAKVVEVKQKTVSLAQKAEIALKDFVARKKEKGQQQLRALKDWKQVVTKPELRKEYGRQVIQPVLKEQYRPERIKEVISPFKYVKKVLPKPYDPETKRILPGSPVYEYQEILKLPKEERRKAEAKFWTGIGYSTLYALHATPKGVAPTAVTQATRGYATYLRGLKKYKIPTKATSKQISKAFEKSILKAEGDLKAVETVLRDFRILDKIKPQEAIRDVAGVTRWFDDLLKPALPAPEVPKAEAPPVLEAPKAVELPAPELVPKVPKAMLPLVKPAPAPPKPPVEKAPPAPAKPAIKAPEVPLKREVVRVEEKLEGVKSAIATIRPDGTAGMVIEIEKESQRAGLGTAIVKELETKVAEKGVKTVKISAFVESRGFWEKQEYKVVEGAVEKAGMIKMEKELVPTPPVEVKKPEVAKPPVKKPIAIEEFVAPEKVPKRIVEEAEEKILAEVRGEIQAIKKGEAYGEIEAKFKNFLRIAGEKKSKETSELFREHIPKSVFGVSTDEVADAKGMSENSYMTSLTKDIELMEGKKITPVKVKSLKRRAKTLYEKLDPKAFTVIRDVLGKVEGILAKPTPKVKAKIAARKVRPILIEERKFLRSLAKRPTPLSQATQLARMIGRATKEVAKANRATPWQIRTIRTLRSRLKVKNRELMPIIEDLTTKPSFAKMTRVDADQVIYFLQPKNWEQIEKEVEQVKKGLFKKREERLIGKEFVAKDPQLEEKFGVIKALNKTATEIENITGVIKNLPPLEADSGSVIKDFLKWTSPYLSEDLGAKLVGIKEGFHTPMRTIIGISKRHTNRMKKGLVEVFKDLSKEERKQVIMIQAGAPSLVKKAASKKVQQVAKYMQDVAEKNIKLVNRLRKATGKPPLKSRKPYIPFIIDENISQAADLFDKNKFWEQRTKTFKEFQAGLFTHDPSRIIDIWSQSSGDWLKKNLFSALLLDRYQNLYNVSGAAAAYGRTIVELDIYNMLPQRERLFRSLGSAINKRVGGIFPKKIPIEPELATAIENTTFGKDLMADVSKGYLKVPRIQLPNVGDVFHKVFYPAKLAWNFSFGLLNRTQPLAGIPFVGIESTLVGRVKMYSMIFPWNKVQRQRYVKILEESGYQYGRYVAGQELKPIKGKIGNAVDRVINFVGDITEMMDRLENEIGAEHFLNQAEGKGGKKLAQADKDTTIGTFSGFINFLGGKGYAPPAQRSLVGRFAYTFNQYPINQLNVFTEMYKVAMKNDGVREFWKLMAKEGGASQEAQDFFNELPDGSKARVFLVFLALALPVAMMYALSRSWNVASRALPGLPRIAFADLASSVSDFLENPEKNAESLSNSVKQLFSVTAKKRLEDALNIVETGILQRGFSKKPLFVDPSTENIYKLFIFGRSALAEYEKQYPSLLGKVFGGRREVGQVRKLQREREKIGKEETETAVEFMRLYTKAKTPEEKRALFKEYSEAGKFTEGVVKKLEKFYKEQATGVGGLERSIVGLKDEDQARFVLEQFNKTKGVEEKKELMIRYKKQGILTENVIAEMKRLAQEETFDQGFFSL